MSGTSMACPHVAGAAALLFQIDPSLSPEQVRKLLTQSTIPVDVNGRQLPRRGTWNAVYGLGKMFIPAAVQLAQRVKRARDGLPSFFAITSPEDLEVQDILREEKIPVTELLKFPKALEDSASWLKAEDL